MESRRVIRVVDLDISGLLSHKDYISAISKIKADSEEERLQLHTEALKKVYPEFLKRLAADPAAETVKTVLLNGSHSQDRESDHANVTRNHIDSAFTALDGLKTSMANFSGKEWEFDPYLLADTFSAQEEGTSLHRALENKPGFKHAMAVRDASKLLLLYTHIHKLAHKYNNTEIIFDYYDVHPEIIDSLHSFFSSNNNDELIPEHVTLRLTKINDSGYMKEVKGKGSTEKDFNDGCWNMLRSVGLHAQEIRRQKESLQCNVLNVFNRNPDLLELKDFKQTRKLVNQMEEVVVVNGDEARSDAPLVDEDQELEALRTQINFAKAAANKFHSIEAGKFVLALNEAYSKIREELRLVKTQNKMTPAKINKSSAITAANSLSDFLLKFNGAQNDAARNTIITNYQTEVLSNRRWRRFKHVLITVAVTLAALVLGAAIGFGVGLAAGVATGPGAAVTAIAGSIFGAIIGAAVGAGVMGVGAATFTGLFVRHKQKAMVATEKAVMEVASKSGYSPEQRHIKR